MQTKTIQYDFSKLSTEESAQDLKKMLDSTLEGVDVSVLVNNVGVAKYGALHDHSVWDSMRQVNVNINS